MPKSTTPPTLQQAIAPYLKLSKLRRLAAKDGAALHEALLTDQPPPEVLALLDALQALVRPLPREQIKQSADIAALLMVEMGYLPQEQLRVVCLNGRGEVQTIQVVYQGTVDLLIIRTAEIFREAIRRNSSSIILAHNRPSGPLELFDIDRLATQEIRAAGRLLSINVIDHLIIGQGQWISLRERKWGFNE